MKITYSEPDKIELVKIGFNDDFYPSRVKTVMGKNAPKHLYMKGNKDLLESPSVGFCGSRKSSKKGLKITKDCAEQVASQDIVVVSGNAAGVDLEAHYNSLKAGGKTIFVLPEGMNQFRVKKVLRDVWDWDNILIISQFEPEAIWRNWQAMQRNYLIIALSRVMIAIEAGETGGTLAAGLKTLELRMPLFVADYQNMLPEAKGNAILLNKGASRLAKSRSTNLANLKRVMEYVYDDIIIQQAEQQKTLAFA